MKKGEIYNKYILLIALFFLGLIYFLFKINFFVTWSPEMVSDVVDPLFFGILGLAFTLLLLLFRGQIFLSWLKQIGWWFIPFTIVMVGNTTGGGFLFPYSRAQVSLFWMAVLFLITLIYAIFKKGK